MDKRVYSLEDEVEAGPRVCPQLLRTRTGLGWRGVFTGPQRSRAGAGLRVCLVSLKKGTGTEPAGGGRGERGGVTGRCLLRLRRKVGLREAVSAPA